MGTRHSSVVKEQVLKLGKAGLTYGEIRNKFPIPKTTLFVWFGHERSGRVVDRTRQLKHLARARVRSAETKRRQKTERLAQADILAMAEAIQVDLENTSILKALLAMLYWAEGGKTDGNTKFTNTDPVLARMFLTLLRRCYPLDESRIKIELQVHHYHQHGAVMNFWSQTLTVPKSQFWKICVKKRGEGKKYRRNFQGICHIHYCSSAVQRELIALGKKLAYRLEH